MAELKVTFQNPEEARQGKLSVGYRLLSFCIVRPIDVYDPKMIDNAISSLHPPRLAWDSAGLSRLAHDVVVTHLIEMLHTEHLKLMSAI